MRRNLYSHCSLILTHVIIRFYLVKYEEVKYYFYLSCMGLHILYIYLYIE